MGSYTPRNSPGAPAGASAASSQTQHLPSQQPLLPHQPLSQPPQPPSAVPGIPMVVPISGGYAPAASHPAASPYGAFPYTTVSQPPMYAYAMYGRPGMQGAPVSSPTGVGGPYAPQPAMFPGTMGARPGGYPLSYPPSDSDQHRPSHHSHGRAHERSFGNPSLRTHAPRSRQRMHSANVESVTSVPSAATAEDNSRSKAPHSHMSPSPALRPPSFPSTDEGDTMAATYPSSGSGSVSAAPQGHRLPNSTHARRFTHSPAIRSESSARDLGMNNAEATMKSYVHSRLPALHPLPPTPTPLTPEQQGSLPEEIQTHVHGLESLLTAYKKREEEHTLRLESVAFNPVLALQEGSQYTPGPPTSEANPSSDQQDGDPPAVKSNTELDPAPILGVRLLHRVQELTEENEELGRLLEKQLFPGIPAPASSTTEIQEMREDLEDAHTLIQQLDAAVTEATARTRQMEAALESVCASNSVGITDSVAHIQLNESPEGTDANTESFDGGGETQSALPEGRKSKPGTAPRRARTYPRIGVRTGGEASRSWGKNSNGLK